MNCASARCRRASCPRSTVKRAPDSLAPASPSSQPLRAPSSTWSLTAKSKLRGVPQRCCSTLPVSSLPGRHRFVRQVRECPARSRRSRPRIVSSRASRGLELVAETGDLGHQRGDVLALGLRLADRLGARVAQVLQLLGAGLDAACARLPAIPARRRRGRSRGCRAGARRVRRGCGAAGSDRAWGRVRRERAWPPGIAMAMPRQTVTGVAIIAALAAQWPGIAELLTPGAARSADRR